MRLIDADALYEKACDLEAQALDYAVKISHDEEKRDEWLKWSAILAERTAFKNDVYDAPTIDPEPHWIPCSERLPEEGQGCLVCDKGSILIDTFIGHGNPYNWKWYTRDYDAWIPLPEPWRGEEYDMG